MTTPKFTPAEAAEIEQGLKGSRTYPPHRAHPLVNQLMERHFGHTQRDARSFEYKAGARALLLSRLGGFLITNPHTPGTAQADAWWAGVEEGKAIYKFQPDARGSRMTEADIYTALDLLVPAMRKKGLSIQAGADSLAIPPGWMAEGIADYLVGSLQCELLMLERRRHYDPRQEAEHERPRR